MDKKLDCIWLVDDDSGTNLFNSKVVQHVGITSGTTVMLNGAEALSHINSRGQLREKEIEVDLQTLIFLDINMPVMDGWEFLEAFAALPATQQDRYRIVVLTTSFNPDDKFRAENNLAVTKYLTKPLTPQKLENLIRQYFPA